MSSSTATAEQGSRTAHRNDHSHVLCARRNRGVSSVSISSQSVACSVVLCWSLTFTNFRTEMNAQRAMMSSFHRRVVGMWGHYHSMGLSGGRLALRAALSPSVPRHSGSRRPRWAPASACHRATSMAAAVPCRGMTGLLFLPLIARRRRETASSQRHLLTSWRFIQARHHGARWHEVPRGEARLHLRGPESS